MGRSQGGFSTKLHLRACGNGAPITAVLTAGERHEQIALDDVIDHSPSNSEIVGLAREARAKVTEAIVAAHHAAGGPL